MIVVGEMVRRAHEDFLKKPESPNNGLQNSYAAGRWHRYAQLIPTYTRRFTVDIYWAS